MIILDTTTRTLEILLSAATTTNPLQFVASYVDINQTVPALTAANTTYGVTNGTTAVTVVPAPAASTSRQLKFLSVQNADTTYDTLTVRLNDGGTLRNIGVFQLAPNDSLVYTSDRGFVVLDMTGGIKKGLNSGSITPMFFSGDGSTTAFTLSSPPPSSSAALVFVSGIQQRSGTDYTISGNALTFTTAPLSGTSNITVVSIGTLVSIGTPSNGTVTAATLGTDTAGLVHSFTPGGRLTNTSNNPVMVTSNANSSYVYYTPYIHDQIMLWTGSSWEMYTFTELTNTLSDTTKNPAATVAGDVYDLFVWSDSGTLRLSRGPAWSSTTTRGTGGGTTQLYNLYGRWVNQYAISNGPTEYAGLYVGTIRVDGSGGGGVYWTLGAAAASGGSNAILGVWNAYNRVRTVAQSMDSTASWVYATANTWRAANGSASARVNYVIGLTTEYVIGTYVGLMLCSVAGWAEVSVGVDTTTARSGVIGGLYSNTANTTAGSSPGSSTSASIGAHYMSANEYCTVANETFYGNTGAQQSGLTVVGEF